MTFEHFGQPHESQRGYFAASLYEQMVANKDIWLLVGDLGYGIFDRHRKDFPDRFVNTGASEQALVGLGTGLALEHKIPIVYSITPFLLYRPFETIRNYLHHEQIPVRLVGSGRDKDYSHDGYSHWATEARAILGLLDIDTYYPESKDEVPGLLKDMINVNRPSFLSLRR